MNNEFQLIEKAKKGDKNSFEEIVDLYKNYVFAIILNFIRDYKEVENVAQEVFLQIYISLPEYKADNFKAWVSRIASNKSIDWIRRVFYLWQCFSLQCFLWAGSILFYWSLYCLLYGSIPFLTHTIL